MEFLKIANQMREDLKKIVSENNIELFTLISEPKEVQEEIRILVTMKPIMYPETTPTKSPAAMPRNGLI